MPTNARAKTNFPSPASGLVVAGVVASFRLSVLSLAALLVCSAARAAEPKLVVTTDPQLPRGIGRRHADDARAQHDHIRFVARCRVRHHPHSHQRQAAIDRQQRSGDVPGLRRQQKRNQRGDVAGFGQSRQRIGLVGPLPALRVQRAEQPGILAGIGCSMTSPQLTGV
jgi:hypothetical protein